MTEVKMLRSPFLPLRAACTAFVAALALWSCESDSPRLSTELDGSSEAGISQPVPGCARPSLGCACNAGTPAIECHLDPIVRDGIAECRRGTRTCRGGSWSSCEDVHSYSVSFDKALGTPTICSVCSPDCQIQTSTPDQNDLISTGSNVRYDPARPGVVVDVDPPIGVTIIDNDADGIPDEPGIDECLGQPGFRAPCDGANTITQDGMFFTLPPGANATDQYPPIDLRLRSADLYILMDTTSSMSGELANLQANLTSGTLPQGNCPAGSGTGLLGALRCTIPDIQFGVGMAREYPNANKGDRFLVPYIPLLDSTSNFPLAQSVINAFTTMGNSEGWPESTGQALYSLASGRGLSRWVPNRGPCANGGVGYACFRPGAVPIIMVITDAPFRQSPNGGTYESRYSLAAENLPPGMTTDFAGTRSIRQAESFATALNLGDLTNRGVTILGSTQNMANDHTGGCPRGGAGADFVVEFTLAQRRNMTFRTEGSDYDGMLFLYRGSAASPTQVACDDDSGGIRDGNGNTVYRNTDGYGASLINNISLDPGTYFLVVDGYYVGSDGATQLRVFNNDVPSSSTSTMPVPIGWSDVTTSLTNIGAKTIGIATCPNTGWGDATDFCPATVRDLQAIANATGSLNASGSPFVYRANPDGSGLSNTVADAVVELSQYLSFDVDVVCVDNPATPINECTAFNVTVPPTATPSACPTTCTGGRTGNTCVDCAPGSNLRFTVNVSNTGAVPQTAAYQVFNFEVIARADARAVLSRIPIRVVVPPIAMQMQETGIFTMNYDASERCVIPPQRPDWGYFSYTQNVPAGTRMDFEFRTADTLAELATAPFTGIAFPSVPTPANPIDIGSLLVSSGQFNQRVFLQFRARLQTNATGTVSPALQSFSMQYTCVDAE